jgi:hypothetical protein
METNITNHTFYPDGEQAFIPDVELVSVSGDDREMSVHFLWRGTKQWLSMSKDNEYNDNSWLVIETDYSEEFEDFLDSELSSYDSLEVMFGTMEILPDPHYNIVVEKEGK